MPKYGYLGDSEARLNSWLDNNLRRVWLKHPARLGVINKFRFKKIAKSKAGTVMMLWHVNCEHCHKDVREYEVNHKSTVLSINDFPRYCNNLFKVTEDDLEVLCKPCHGVITYMERSGMSFEDAAIEKKCIKFTRLPAIEQKNKLIQAGILIEGRTNESQRKDAVREHLRARRRASKASVPS